MSSRALSLARRVPVGVLGAMLSIGVGYRLAVQGRLNLQVDIGVGSASQAFYFNFNEAF